MPRDKACLIVASTPIFKRDCRKAYPGPTGTNPDVHAVRHEKVEKDDTHLPMAVCHEAC